MTFKQYKNQILQDPRSEKLNFNKVDDRYYYVYRIIEDNKEYYYGSRVSNLEPHIDLPEYGTSSKRKKLIKENRDSIYTFKIVKVLDNNGDKILWEAYLHQYFNVKLHDKFWNESNQTPFGFDTTGRKLSEEHKEKISETNKGKVLSDKTKKRMSESRKGIIFSVEHKNNIKNNHHNCSGRNNPNFGKKVTKETRKKQSEWQKGKPKWSKEEKELMSTTRKGSSNGNAQKINIIDSQGVLRFTCDGNFKRVCKDNNLPYSALNNAKLKNIPVFDTIKGKNYAIKNNLECFIGWTLEVI